MTNGTLTRRTIVLAIELGPPPTSVKQRHDEQYGMRRVEQNWDYELVRRSRTLCGKDEEHIGDYQ